LRGVDHAYGPRETIKTRPSTCVGARGKKRKEEDRRNLLAVGTEGTVWKRGRKAATYFANQKEDTRLPQ